LTSSFFYFLYFAALGIYVPYWTLFLQHLELTSLQIGTMYSISSIARILLPAFYGYAADRLNAAHFF
jgi:PPP family 3-phenylpropionic acid transporter